MIFCWITHIGRNQALHETYYNSYISGSKLVSEGTLTRIDHWRTRYFFVWVNVALVLDPSCEYCTSWNDDVGEFVPLVTFFMFCIVALGVVWMVIHCSFSYFFSWKTSLYPLSETYKEDFARLLGCGLQLRKDVSFCQLDRQLASLCNSKYYVSHFPLFPFFLLMSASL